MNASENRFVTKNVSILLNTFGFFKMAIIFRSTITIITFYFLFYFSLFSKYFLNSIS